ncbi:MAG: M90 family metallopeptidase [Anaerolineales bacterium]
MSLLDRMRQLFGGRQDLPTRWQNILDDNVPLLARLEPETKHELYSCVHRFLREKKFEGVQGQPINEEVKLTIAAQACLLHLGLEGPLYPKLRTILVYPGAYIADDVERTEEGIELPGKEARAGESWGHGTLLLSWADVVHGAADPGDGSNLVFHEFAHKLDEETGESNGSPVLPSAEHQERWQRAFSNAYETLRRAIDHGSTIGPFNPYAASSPAEFFAVSTELFFERPGALRAFDRDLYQQLQSFYHPIRSGQAAEEGQPVLQDA